ncbi:hypothetical protein TNCV_3704781 [Trichonephila clavipes]|nr:hypothetical protein TNCV_3704781 [Trichonephila clavipes]
MDNLSHQSLSPTNLGRVDEEMASPGFFAMLPVLGKKAVLEWCMKEGLIGSSYVCPKCGKSMKLRERTGIASVRSQPFETLKPLPLLLLFKTKDKESFCILLDWWGSSLTSTVCDTVNMTPLLLLSSPIVQVCEGLKTQDSKFKKSHEYKAVLSSVLLAVRS